MEITDIRVKLIHESKERLRAVCSVTFDDAFVVRDVKVVDGTNGTFVAMPSRKLSSHCPKCRHKNQIRARHCNECGAQLPPPRPPEDSNGRSRFHRDIAHPINTEFRELLQQRVIEAFEKEVELAGSEAQVGTDDRKPKPDAPDRDRKREEQHESKTETRAPSDAHDPEIESEFGADLDKDQERAAIESEYDSLIAGLNPGSPERGRTPQRPEDRKRDNNKRSEKKEGRRPRSDRNERRTTESKPPEKHAEPSLPVEPAALQTESDAKEDTAFGAEILVEPKNAPRAAKTPSKKVERAAPDPAPVQETVNTSCETDDQDDGFGAGL